MVERTTTYSVNPDDYEYDTNTHHLRHIPGIGMYQFANNATEQQIKKASDNISLTSELQYSNLHKDTVLLNSFKRYYKRKNGEDFTGTDEEAVDAFMSDFAYIDNNLTFGLGKVLVNQNSLSEQDKFDVGLLFDRYDRTNATGEGSRPFKDQFLDVSEALIKDPLNYIGVFTGGAGFLARGVAGKVGGQTAKNALIRGFRKSIFGAYGREVAKRPITTGMISGAGWASTYDIEKQNLEIDSGIREVRHNVTGESESFNYDELLTTAVIGAGFGGALGTGSKALSKFFSNGSYSKILGKDRTTSTTDDLKKEMVSRELDIEDTPTIITKENIDDAYANNVGASLSPGIEQEYPLNWVNANGESIKVTVSNRTISRASPEAPETTQVTLKDTDGIEYNVVTNENGGIAIRRFKSDDDMRDILDRVDLKEMSLDYELDAQGKPIVKETPVGKWNPMKKAHGFLVRNFTSHFGLGPETAERMRDAERMLIASGEKIDILIKRFEKAWKKEKGTSFNEAERAIHHTFIKALTTHDSKAAKAADIQSLLPDGSEVKEVVDEWRSLIAETSRDLIESGAFSKYKLNTKGERILDDTGNPIENTFFKTLQKKELEKTYLHRMYSMYEDPDYNKKSLGEKLNQKEYDEIIKYFKSFDGINDDDAALQAMVSIAVPSTARKLKGKGGVAPTKIKLEDIDEKYVKMLLGEITDPRQLFAGTVFKTKKIVEDYKLKRDLVSIGLRRSSTQKPFMTRGSPRKDWQAIKAGSRSFELNDEQLNGMWNNEAKKLLDNEPASFMDNPFDNIFIDPEYKKYYDAMSNFYDLGESAIQRVMAGSTFAFNLSKTVLSPTTHMRNFIGGMLQNAYNGIVPFSTRAWVKAVASTSNIEGSPTYSIFRRTVPMFNKFKKRGELNDGDVDSITRLIELGVVHNGMRAGLFKEAYNLMIKNANPLHHLENKLFAGKGKETLTGKGKRTLVKAVDVASEVYEMSDNINKISAFESEFGWLFRAFGDGKNTDAFIKHADTLGVFDVRKRLNEGESISRLIEEAAAKKVNMFTPTYSQLTGSTRIFRQYPIGNFVAFPMEVTRNYTNSWRLAARELRSGSAAMRARGSIRAASLAGASGITVGGIGGFSAALNGITDDQREALESKYLSAEWAFGTNYFYMGKLKDGTLKAMPLGYTDPFSYLSRIAQVAMHSFNENESDAVLNSRLINASWESFKVAMDPYIIPAVGPAALAKVFEEITEASQGRKEFDGELINRELRKAMYPTFFKNIEDLTTSITKTKWGTEVDPKWHTYLGLVSGLKPQNVHIPSRVGFALSDAHREKSANTFKLNKFINNRQNWQDPNLRENLIEEYKNFLTKEKEIARRVKTIFGHGLTLGLNGETLSDLARGSFKGEAAGPDKYKASFSNEYIKNIFHNEYPIKRLQGKALRIILNTLRDEKVPGEDMIMRDLDSILQQENKNIYIED